MTTIRWGVIAATGAFLLSLFLGIIAGNQALRTILTAFVFAFIFFGAGFCLRVMVNNFFPELMYLDNQPETEDSYEDESPKNPVFVENSGEYAVPEMYRIPGKNPELGNIEDLISGNFSPGKVSVDAKPEEEYNNTSASVFSVEEEKLSVPSAPPVFTPSFTPSFGDDEGLGGLPDLDVMAMAFSAAAGEGPKAPDVPVASAGSDEFSYSTAAPATVQFEDNEPDRSQYKGNKPQPLEGDFDAKEIAMGIRTVLNKDKQ